MSCMAVPWTVRITAVNGSGVQRKATASSVPMLSNRGVQQTSTVSSEDSLRLTTRPTSLKRIEKRVTRTEHIVHDIAGVGEHCLLCTFLSLCALQSARMEETLVGDPLKPMFNYCRRAISDSSHTG